MADPAYTPDHPAETPDHPAEDDVIIYTPHRQLIVAAGKLARAEQERLERELGRSPRARQG
jgi:hypothetical protein